MTPTTRFHQARSWSRGRVLAVVFAAVMAFALGGCAMLGNDIDNYLGRDDSRDTPILERGSFEDARTRLDAMVDRMAAELTTAFGDCPPMTRQGVGDTINGGGTAKDDINGIRPYVLDSDYRFTDCTVSDTRERADTAIEIVTTIAADYGFSDPIVFNDDIAPDGEGYIAFEGWHPDGDKYSFGSGNATSITYVTAPRFTADQLTAFANGQTPHRPLPHTLNTTPPPTDTTTSPPEP